MLHLSASDDDDVLTIILHTAVFKHTLQKLNLLLGVTVSSSAVPNRKR